MVTDEMVRRAVWKARMCGTATSDRQMRTILETALEATLTREEAEEVLRASDATQEYRESLGPVRLVRYMTGRDKLRSILRGNDG